MPLLRGRFRNCECARRPVWSTCRVDAGRRCRARLEASAAALTRRRSSRAPKLRTAAGLLDRDLKSGDDPGVFSGREQLGVTGRDPCVAMLGAGDDVGEAAGRHPEDACGLLGRVRERVQARSPLRAGAVAAWRGAAPPLLGCGAWAVPRLRRTSPRRRSACANECPAHPGRVRRASLPSARRPADQRPGTGRRCSRAPRPSGRRRDSDVAFDSSRGCSGTRSSKPVEAPPLPPCTAYAARVRYLAAGSTRRSYDLPPLGTEGAPLFCRTPAHAYQPSTGGYKFDVKAFTVEALDESTWPAFAELVERNNGVFGGCWCMGFHPEGVGKETTAELNRERKLERVRAGTTHAALVFDGDNCVGWCQFGAPSELPRIKSRAAYEKGVATAARLADRLQLRRQGPPTPGSRDSGTRRRSRPHRRARRRQGRGLPGGRGLGPCRLPVQRCALDIRTLGFVRDRKIGKHRWVVAKVVEPLERRT